MKINNLVKIYHTEINPETIIFNEKIREFCKRAYPKHKNGCPNYNKNPLCPPQAPYRKDILKKHSNFILVWANFDFKSYKEKMKENHQTWSEKQITCVLYWQGSLKKIIKDYIVKNLQYNELFGCGSGFLDSQSMESAGINVFSTLKLNKIDYEIKPVDKIVLVALLCLNNKKRTLQDYFK